jgi:hypothetical protein
MADIVDRLHGLGGPHDEPVSPEEAAAEIESCYSSKKHMLQTIGDQRETITQLKRRLAEAERLIGELSLGWESGTEIVREAAEFLRATDSASATQEQT